ncbi:hypothetical protein HMPREF0645_2427 [Hallella bergensis DSM 17361]|uniref:Uncharacterized protein n=1 Tax=Hallella bergensis DSM 17361 TaxID=585502 RepID=D1PZP2_9BACT|nr:hypothetical protein HMPREF0645_2427 [Hallella bergensis DSM 17361]
MMKAPCKFFLANCLAIRKISCNFAPAFRGTMPNFCYVTYYNNKIKTRQNDYCTR